MIKVYTCGYMAGEGSDRFDWRKSLQNMLPDDLIKYLHPGVPNGAIPGQGDPKFYSARDILQIRQCDVLFAYFDLSVAKSLGASLEMGLAYGYEKRIIMVDKSPDIGSLDLNRAIADVVWLDLEGAARHLEFVAEGF